MPPILCILLVLSLIRPAETNAEIYKYTNEKGVVSFTDDLGRIPEKFRDKAVIVKPEDLPPLLDLPATDRPVPNSPPARWIDRSFSKFTIALAVLAVSMFLLMKTGAGGIALRMVVKLLFIALIGAAITSLLLVQGSGPVSRSSDPGSARSSRPSVSPVQRATEAVGSLEAGEKKKAESLETIVREPGLGKKK